MSSVCANALADANACADVFATAIAHVTADDNG